jgi:hypothetical protein
MAMDQGYFGDSAPTADKSSLLAPAPAVDKTQDS